MRVLMWGRCLCRLEMVRPEALELKQAMPSLPRGTEHTFESVVRRLAELNAGIVAVRSQARAADLAAASAIPAAGGIGAGGAGSAGCSARSVLLPTECGGKPSATSTVPSLLLGDPSRGSCGSPRGVRPSLCCRACAAGHVVCIDIASGDMPRMTFGTAGCLFWRTACALLARADLACFVALVAGLHFMSQYTFPVSRPRLCPFHACLHNCRHRGSRLM